MAITTNTFSVPGNYTRSQVLTQLEDALSWLGWHGDTQTGIVTGISAYSGGGTYTTDVGGNFFRNFEDVRPISTTGIGTGASFRVRRYNGSINPDGGIWVNRPGVGYTNGEYVILSAEDVGGSANGATGIGITVFVAGGESPVGYGSTTQFYDFDKSGSFPWGVVRHTIEPNKRYGDTYRGIQVSSSTGIRLSVGNGFHPWDTTNISNRGNYFANRFSGVENVDAYYSIFSSSSQYVTTTTKGGAVVEITYASNFQYPVDLNVYRSSIDPNFAVFSYKHPTLSSTHLTDTTYSTFFFHNFTTNIWDLDNLFLGGYTTIIPTTGNTTSPRIIFRSYLGGDNGVLRREGGNGYLSFNIAGAFLDNSYVDSVYQSMTYPQSLNSEYNRNYYRSITDSLRSKGGNSSQGNDSISSNADFNAVIKGLPLSTAMVPCPYYLPDDFVLIDFDSASPNSNIQQGDTITISGSEVYTVITGSYNQTTRTRGILFCARTV
jgi:hypothetical protein